MKALWALRFPIFVCIAMLALWSYSRRPPPPQSKEEKERVASLAQRASMRKWVRANIPDPDAELLKVHAEVDRYSGKTRDAEIRMRNKYGGWEINDFRFRFDMYDGLVDAEQLEPMSAADRFLFDRKHDPPRR